MTYQREPPLCPTEAIWTEEGAEKAECLKTRKHFRLFALCAVDEDGFHQFDQEDFDDDYRY